MGGKSLESGSFLGSIDRLVRDEGVGMCVVKLVLFFSACVCVGGG